jgi:hypothetical protein
MLSSDRARKIRLKVERAKKHILDLDQRIRAFCDSNPYTIAAKPHPLAAIAHTTLYVATVDPVPEDLALIIGDAIHNLRSSLDHLAWQLVEAGGGVPNKSTYFPICQSSHQYVSAMGSGDLARIPPGAEHALFVIQPYVTGIDTLSILHELDIFDKHRLLITAISTLDRWGVDLARSRTLWFDKNRFIALTPNHDIVNIPTSTYERQRHEDFKLGVDIAFSEPKIVEGIMVVSLLSKIADFVDGVVTDFEPFL